MVVCAPNLPDALLRETFSGFSLKEYEAEGNYAVCQQDTKYRTHFHLDQLIIKNQGSNMGSVI